MFSLYTYTAAILFVYFALFLEYFFVFFEDLFLILAFISFLILLFNLFSTVAKTIAEERAEDIRQAYWKLFYRRQEAIRKSKESLNKLYLKQDKDLIVQIAALYYLRHVYGLRIQKKVLVHTDHTALQSLFIGSQKQLKNKVRLIVARRYMKK
jgi:hypothetical protein